MTEAAGTTAEVEVVLKNKYGLHARPATLIAQTAKPFDAKISLEKDGQTVDAKSIFGMLTLAAECGSRLTLRAEGIDSADAVAKLAEVIENFEIDD